MKNFKWLIKNKLAGSSIPKTKQDLKFLKENGITSILSLTDTSFTKETLDEYGIKNHKIIKIRNFDIPTLDQLDECLKFIQETYVEGCLVHCLHGKGRTSTILLAYLIRQGNSYQEAIIERGSDVESHKQISFLKQLEKDEDLI